MDTAVLAIHCFLSFQHIRVVVSVDYWNIPTEVR